MHNIALDELACKFFKLFSQYESSLKERGYFRIVGRNQPEADWDRFVNEKIGSDFLEKLENKSASAVYILDHPPMKQVIEDGEIIWQEVSSTEKSVQALFGHIRRIRNNLHHGAKFNGTWFAPERSQNLISNALEILEHFKPIIESH
ncbi:MAG: hypothetical protein PHV10_07170 [Sulfuricurvum sp.]|nr:hypothetical protein [Sulfuricurvum sp.]